MAHSCSCCCSTVARLRGTVLNLMRTVLTTISNEFPLRQYASMIRCKGGACWAGASTVLCIVDCSQIVVLFVVDQNN